MKKYSKEEIAKAKEGSHWLSFTGVGAADEYKVEKVTSGLVWICGGKLRRSMRLSEHLSEKLMEGAFRRDG